MAVCLRAFRCSVVRFPALKLGHAEFKAQVKVQLQKLINCSSRAITCSVARHRYDEVFRESIERPEDFWAEAAEQVVWHKKWDKVLDNSNPPFTKWLVNHI